MRFDYDAGVKWLQDAYNDGWEIKESTPDSNKYDISKGDFTGYCFVHRYTFLYFFTDGDSHIDMSMQHKRIWIEIPETYSPENMQRSLRICGQCKREVDETYKIYISGRACMECLEKAEKIEGLGKW